MVKCSPPFASQGGRSSVVGAECIGVAEVGITGMHDGHPACARLLKCICIGLGQGATRLM